MFNSFSTARSRDRGHRSVVMQPGLRRRRRGSRTPPRPSKNLPLVMRPKAEGGQLHQQGRSKLCPRSIATGGDSLRYSFRRVGGVRGRVRLHPALLSWNTGVRTDPSGRYASMYKRWQPDRLEVGISVASVGYAGEPTGWRDGLRADAVASASATSGPAKFSTAKRIHGGGG